MKRAISLALAALLCVATANSASAGASLGWSVRSPHVPTSRERVGFVGGWIQPGFYSLFLEIMKSADPDIVVVSGPGGRIDEALLIAAEIRKRGLNTFVYSTQECSSACALMFLSGKTKYIYAGAAIGLHSSRYFDGSASIEGTIAMARYLAEIGVPLSIISRMSATAPSSMMWLTAEDREALDIETLAPPYAQQTVVPGQ